MLRTEKYKFNNLISLQIAGMTNTRSDAGSNELSTVKVLFFFYLFTKTNFDDSKMEKSVEFDSNDTRLSYEIEAPKE